MILNSEDPNVILIRSQMASLVLRIWIWSPGNPMGFVLLWHPLLPLMVLTQE